PHREEHAFRAHAEPVLAGMRLDDAEFDEIVEQRPLDQRPEIAADAHIGLDPLGGACLEAQRMLAAGPDEILALGPKADPPGLAAHLHRQERRVAAVMPTRSTGVTST